MYTHWSHRRLYYYDMIHLQQSYYTPFPHLLVDVLTISFRVCVFVDIDRYRAHNNKSEQIVLQVRDRYLFYYRSVYTANTARAMTNRVCVLYLRIRDWCSPNKISIDIRTVSLDANIHENEYLLISLSSYKQKYFSPPPPPLSSRRKMWTFMSPPTSLEWIGNEYVMDRNESWKTYYFAEDVLTNSNVSRIIIQSIK